MTIANYKTSMEHFYSICDMALTSCQQQLPTFSAFKNKYNASYITDLRASVATARAMPGNQVRGAASESMRIELLGLAELSRQHFQACKRYIAEAFAPIMQKPQYEAAGQQYYEKAGQNNWDAIESLNLYGSQYVITNEDTLSTKGYMPIDFKNSYINIVTNFRAKHQEYMQQEESNEEGAQAKVIANNLIFDELIKMLIDGQLLFTNNEAIRKQFIYADLLDRVGGIGTAGIKGDITDGTNLLPIAKVLVQIINNPKYTTTNYEGHYEIKAIAQGTYDLRFTCIDYQDVIMTNITVSVGITSTLNVVMNRLP